MAIWRSNYYCFKYRNIEKVCEIKQRERMRAVINLVKLMGQNVFDDSSRNSCKVLLKWRSVIYIDIQRRRYKKWVDNAEGVDVPICGVRTCVVVCELCKRVQPPPHCQLSVEMLCLLTWPVGECWTIRSGWTTTSQRQLSCALNCQAVQQGGIPHWAIIANTTLTIDPVIKKKSLKNENKGRKQRRSDILKLSTLTTCPVILFFYILRFFSLLQLWTFRVLFGNISSISKQNTSKSLCGGFCPQSRHFVFFLFFEWGYNFPVSSGKLILSVSAGQ